MKFEVGKKYKIAYEELEHHIWDFPKYIQIVSQAPRPENLATFYGKTDTVYTYVDLNGVHPEGHFEETSWVGSLVEPLSEIEEALYVKTKTTT